MKIRLLNRREPDRLLKKETTFLLCAKIIVFALLSLSLISCTQDHSPQKTGMPFPVKVGSISHIEEYETISVTGYTVSPGGSTALSFLTSGRVVHAGPREGDFVHQGQALASIDPTDYTFAAQAAGAQARQAKIGFERAQDEYQRMKFLYESKSIAPNDFNKFQAASNAAREQYAQAAINDQVARKRLADAVLRAPYDGYIARRGVEQGDIVSPGRPVFELVRLDPLEISVGVPETDIRLVKPGQQAVVTAPALPGEQFTGTVRNVSIAADPATRTYMTRITVSNPRHILRVGMVAEARISGNRLIRLMTLPGDTIVRDPQGATRVFVYYPKEMRVYARRVDVGILRGSEVEIRKGLSGDETIVLAGQDKLHDGGVVTVVSTPAPGATGR